VELASLGNAIVNIKSNGMSLRNFMKEDMLFNLEKDLYLGFSLPQWFSGLFLFLEMTILGKGYK
jgi:hypothetical protein